MDRRSFDEALLDTRSPAEFALGPDGRSLAFALQSIVNDVGRHSPSEVWLGGVDGAPIPLTAGRAPVWAPDGTQLAFLSDRIVPGHHLPYVVATAPGAENRDSSRGSMDPSSPSPMRRSSKATHSRTSGRCAGPPTEASRSRAGWSRRVGLTSPCRFSEAVNGDPGGIDFATRIT